VRGRSKINDNIYSDLIPHRAVGCRTGGTRWRSLSLPSARDDGGAVQRELEWGNADIPTARIDAGIGEGADVTTVTVWESKEAYDTFAPTFTRVMNEKGFRFGAPRILPVHHFLASQNDQAQ
jgi:hypothetical protein